MPGYLDPEEQDPYLNPDPTKWPVAPPPVIPQAAPPTVQNGLPPIDPTALNAARARLAGIQQAPPVISKPKWWQGLAAGALGAAAGYSNAAGRTRAIDPTTAEQGILYPGLATKQAQYQQKVQGAQAQVEAEQAKIDTAAKLEQINAQAEERRQIGQQREALAKNYPEQQARLREKEQIDSWTRHIGNLTKGRESDVVYMEDGDPNIDKFKQQGYGVIYAPQIPGQAREVVAIPPSMVKVPPDLVPPGRKPDDLIPWSEFKAAQQNQLKIQQTEAKPVKPGKADELQEEVQARTKIADQMGLKGRDRTAFITTGKFAEYPPSYTVNNIAPPYPGSTPSTPGSAANPPKSGGGPVGPLYQSAKNPNIDPTVEALAWEFLLNGKMPFTGMSAGKGQRNAREWAVPRAHELAAVLGINPTEIPAYRQELKANGSALQKIVTTGAQIGQFEKTLQNNMQTAQKLSEEYKRGNIQLFNRVLGAFKTNTGDPEALNLAGQLHGIAREWGKIMQGSTSAAGVPVSEGNAADELFSKGITNGQLASFMQNVIVPDVRNRTNAIEAERAALMEKMRHPFNTLSGGGQQNPPPQGGTAPPAGQLNQSSQDILRKYGIH